MRLRTLAFGTVFLAVSHLGTTVTAVAEQPAATVGTAELANLAASLAETAAKLAEAQGQQPINQATAQSAAASNTSLVGGNLDAAAAFAGEDSPVGLSTVRWLGSTSEENLQVYDPDEGSRGRTKRMIEGEQALLQEMGLRPNVTQATASQSRPATRSSHNRPVTHVIQQGRPAARATAIAAPSQSRIIRAQASEDVYFTARALQDNGAPVQEQLDPAPLNGRPTPIGSREPAYLQSEDEAYLKKESKDWGASAVTCGTGCDGPTCDIGCDGPPCSGGVCYMPIRCRPKPIFVVGTEAVFVSVDMNGPPVSVVTENNVGSAYTNSYSTGGYADIDDLYVAPRMWLGVQGQCWGVQGRYFHLRAGEHGDDPYVPLNGWEGYEDSGFWAHQTLDAYYIDLELTRNFCLHGTKHQFSFGARYASLDHEQGILGSDDVSPTIIGGANDGLLRSAANAHRDAHGTGMTFGWNGRKPLFCNSCAHWFWDLRSSVLWGGTRSHVETFAMAIDVTDGDAIAGADHGALAQVLDQDLFIGEVRVGIEWDFALRCLPAKALCRVAVEYQNWDAADGRATATSFAGFGTGPDSQITAFADAPGPRMDLFGFSVATGFTW